MGEGGTGGEGGGACWAETVRTDSMNSAGKNVKRNVDFIESEFEKITLGTLNLVKTFHSKGLVVIGK